MQWEKSIARKQENGTPIMNGVNPVVVLGAECVIKIAEKQGINAIIVQGYRTKEYQDKLYAQGRTTAGDIVTRTKGGQSPHNHGLAVDFVLEPITWTRTPEWEKVAEIAEELGFTWGGRWKGFVDNPHIEMTFGMKPSEWQQRMQPAKEKQIAACQNIWKVCNKYGMNELKINAHQLAEVLRK